MPGEIDGGQQQGGQQQGGQQQGGQQQGGQQQGGQQQGGQQQGGQQQGGQQQGGQQQGGQQQGVPGFSPEHSVMLHSKAWLNNGTPDVAKILAGYSELERAVGADKVVLPGKDAKPEDWAPIYNKLGRPEKPEQYDLSGFKPTDGVPWQAEQVQAAIPALHALGLTQSQLVGVLGVLDKSNAGMWNDMTGRQADTVKQSRAALEREWGAEAPAKQDLANRAATVAFGKDLPSVKQMQLMDGTYVLDHPQFSRAFAAIGAAIAEDGDAPGLRDGMSAAMSGGPAGARAELDKLAKDDGFKKILLDRAHPEHKAAIDKRARLMQIAYPEEVR